jgi:hypothetical protein
MHETFLGDVDKPIAIGDARLMNAMRLCQLNLGNVTAHSARHHNTIETSQHRYRRFAREDDDRTNDGTEIGVPDLAACDHNAVSSARAAAASSMRSSSAVSGVDVYAAR